MGAAKNQGLSQSESFNAASSRARLMGRHWADHGRHLGDPRHWKSAQLGMLEDERLAFSKVDAERLVRGHIRLEPLDFWCELGEHAVGLRSNALECSALSLPTPGISRSIRKRFIVSSFACSPVTPLGLPAPSGG